MKHLLSAFAACLLASGLACAAPAVAVKIPSNPGIFKPLPFKNVPAALSSRVKLDKIAELLAASGQPVTLKDLKLPSPMTLDVAHPHTGHGDLEFADAEWVSARENRAILANTIEVQGGAHIIFTPPKPGFYLLDFNLSNDYISQGEGKILRLMELGGQPQDQTAKTGDGHALFLLDYSGNAVVPEHLLVFQSNVRTAFYSVQISLVK